MGARQTGQTRDRRFGKAAKKLCFLSSHHVGARFVTLGETRQDADIALRTIDLYRPVDDIG